jgi:hypothetical protein
MSGDCQFNNSRAGIESMEKNIGTYPDFLVQPLLPLVEPVKALLVALEQLERLRRDLGGALLVAVIPRGRWLNCLEESNGQCNRSP